MSWLSRNTTNSSSASYSLIDNQSLISSSHRPPSPSPPSPPPNTNYYNNNNNNNNNNIRLTTMTSKGPAAEIQEQTTNLSRLNGRLERMMAKMGTSADTPDFRDRMQSEQTSGSDLCKTAMIRLQKMANDKSSPQNNYFPRLAKDFEKEMIKFQNLLSEIEHKRDKIIENAHRRHSLSDNKSGSLSGREKLLRNNNMDDQIFSSNNNNNNNNNYNNYANNNYNNNNNNNYNNNTSYSNQVALQQQQQQQHQEIDFEDSDIADLERRNLQIKALEGQMLEIAEMFHDMQKIVHEQQEVIDIIDNNISNAAIKVEEGHEQLLEAEQLQIKARKRKCAITFCLLILAGIIVLIVYFLAK